MITGHRFQITFISGAFAVAALSAIALAQVRPSSIECRDNETGSECHARLNCKANENLTDCQMRLLRCSADESLEECKRRVGGQRGGDGGGGRQDDDARGGGRDDTRGGNRGDQGSDRGDRSGRERGQDDDDGGGYYGRDDDDRGGNRGSRWRRGGRSGGGGGGGGGGGFQANKTFGLGLELGEPTGLSGKYFFSDTAALDFGVGWVYRHYYYGDGLHLYGDFLVHPVSLASNDAFELPLYIGGGLRFWDFDYCYMGVCTYGGSAIGIRVPIGIAFDFNNVPLDIFIQLVPVIDLVRGDYYDRYGDRAHFGIDGSVGIRFWFK